MNTYYYLNVQYHRIKDNRGEVKSDFLREIYMERNDVDGSFDYYVGSGERFIEPFSDYRAIFSVKKDTITLAKGTLEFAHVELNKPFIIQLETNAQVYEVTFLLTKKEMDFRIPEYLYISVELGPSRSNWEPVVDYYYISDERDALTERKIDVPKDIKTKEEFIEFVDTLKKKYNIEVLRIDGLERD